MLTSFCYGSPFLLWSQMPLTCRGPRGRFLVFVFFVSLKVTQHNAPNIEKQETVGYTKPVNLKLLCIKSNLVSGLCLDFTVAVKFCSSILSPFTHSPPPHSVEQGRPQKLAVALSIPQSLRC